MGQLNSFIVLSNVFIKCLGKFGWLKKHIYIQETLNEISTNSSFDRLKQIGAHSGAYSACGHTFHWRASGEVSSNIVKNTKHDGIFYVSPFLITYKTKPKYKLGYTYVAKSKLLMSVATMGFGGLVKCSLRIDGGHGQDTYVCVWCGD